MTPLAIIGGIVLAAVIVAGAISLAEKFNPSNRKDKQNGKQ